jgi:hypothetical protein
MYQALLLPLLSHHPSTTAEWSEPIEVNYDAILPSTRRNVARSRSTCTQSMKQLRADLAKWGERCTGQQATGIGGSAVSEHKRDQCTASEQETKRSMVCNREKGGEGSSEVVGKKGGLAAQMRRPVRLVAVTPTRQISMSSVGREVSRFPRKDLASSRRAKLHQLWFCSLHAIHHFSMLRTIAVHELVR